MFKAVIFDLDGVLIDSEPFFFLAHKNALKVNQVHISEAEYILQGMNRNQMLFYSGLIERHGVKFDMEQTKNAMWALFNDRMNNISLMAGVIGFIDKLKMNSLRTAVVTASPRESYAKIVLGNNKILDRFEFIIGSEDCHHHKPHPHPYLEALKRLGLEPNECVVIEDAEVGIQSAKAAGLFCYALRTKFSAGQDFSKADKEISSFSEVILE